MSTSVAEAPEEKRSVSQRMLDGVERLGNRVPHPVMIFLGLILLVIALSAILAAFDVSVTYQVEKPNPVPAEQYNPGGSHELEYATPPGATDTNPDYTTVTETAEVESLLSADGIRFIFTSAVSNFNDFGVVAVILVAMIGVGVAEEAGLIAALIRRLVKAAPKWALTFIIVLIGILSSVASDAGYLVLIPLAAVAFASVGRHPLAGIAAGFAGVGATFGVNVLITPVDGIVTEVTNEATALIDPNRSIDITANLYFGIGSTIFLAFVITWITTRLIEPRLGPWKGGAAETEEAALTPEAESRGLRYAGMGLLAVLALIVLLTVFPDAPLRNPETGSVIDNSPLMNGLIFIIMLIFLVAGLAYGKGAGTMHGSKDAMAAITKTFAGLGGLIFMLLVIAQFIAYFNFTNMATIAAVGLADPLENADIGPVWLLVALIVVTMIIDLIIPGVIPKWAILAPVFVPLFLRLDVAPQTVLAAYRVGDSPVNVITPLMVYLPFIVLLAQKYRKDAGMGTVVSLMIPYTLVVAVAWLLFFVAWYLLGIPLGPGSPVHT
jgi:para-aminobenzoyl-glutamate transporter family